MRTRLKEKKEVEARRLEAALQAMRWRTDPKIQLICSRRMMVNPMYRDRWLGAPPDLRQIAMAGLNCRSEPEKRAFRELIEHTSRYAPRLLDAADCEGRNPYLAGLLSLARQHKSWMRPLLGFSPTTHNAGRIFSQLARHLLAQYPVPSFLDSLLLSPGQGVPETWFPHLGCGGSLRTAPGLTVPLTKRQAHFCLRAPNDRDVVQAIRWGQVLGFGGTGLLAGALMRTRLGCAVGPEAHEEWRQTVILWFVHQPLLKMEHVGPLVDYLEARRAREPGFEMKGRTPAALLRLVNEWHHELAAERRVLEQHHQMDVRPCGAKPGRWHGRKGGAPALWTVEEILTLNDLLDEGKAMRHCVASYADAIQKGACAIWSLRVNRYGVTERVITIELQLATRRIVQARGMCNRLPNLEEYQLLQRWADENGLTVDVL